MYALSIAMCLWLILKDNVNDVHISTANILQIVKNKENEIIVINYEVVYDIAIDTNPFLYSG